MQLSDRVKKNDRQARLAEALRANLKRRKAQAKRRANIDDRANAPPDEAPAVNPPQTDPKGGGGAR
jgi:hypothetical protein